MNATPARLNAVEEGRIDIAMASHGLDEADLEKRALTTLAIAKTAVVFAVLFALRLFSAAKLRSRRDSASCPAKSQTPPATPPPASGDVVEKTELGAEKVPPRLRP